MDESALGNILAALVSKNGDGNNFGGNFMWVIAIVFIMIAFGGNFGGFGNRGGASGGPPVNVATQSDVFGSTAWQASQDNINAVNRSVNDIALSGLAQANSINQNVSQQGADTRLSICQTGNNITKGIAEIGFLTQNKSDQIRYEAAQHTCEITSNDTANTQKILDKLCQMEANAQATRIQELTVANQALNLQLGQQAQTAAIVNTLRPYPQPAYLTASPYSGLGYAFNYGPGYSYGNFT